MKQTKLLWGAALALGMTACTNENNDSLSNNFSDEISSIRISASNFKYENLTRTDFIIDSNGAKFIWAENDTIGIFPRIGDQLGFPMIDGAGANLATFHGGGWALQASEQYYAYYPFSRANFVAADKKNNVEFIYTGQTQSANDCTKGLGAYDFMAAAETTSTNGSLNFEFKHLGSLMQFNIKAPATAVYTELTLSVDEALFPTKATIDLQTNPIVLNVLESAKSFSLSLQNIAIEEDATMTLNMMFPPADLTGKMIAIALKDANGCIYETSVAGKNYEANGAYRITTDMAVAEGLEASEPVFDAATKTYLITDGNELLWLAENNSALKPTGVNAKLMNDIDLKNFPWTPIQIFVSENVFVFDGNGYTISNLYIDGLNKKDMGLFGGGDISAIIKNLTIDGAKIENCNDRVGVIAGKMSGELINCHVKNSSVMSADNDPYVRKYGALVGLFSGWIVEDCSVSNVTVKAHSEIGGLFGCSNETTQNLNNCKVENTTLWATSPETDYSTDIYVGRKDVKINYSNCSYSNVTIK